MFGRQTCIWRPAGVHFRLTPWQHDTLPDPRQKHPLPPSLQAQLHHPLDFTQPRTAELPSLPWLRGRLFLRFLRHWAGHVQIIAWNMKGMQLQWDLGWAASAIPMLARVSQACMADVAGV